MNRLWLTQMYLYRFYIPDLVRLANDIEVNPGPSPSNVDPSRLVHGLKRKVEGTESSRIPKNSKLMYTPNSDCQYTKKQRIFAG